MVEAIFLLDGKTVTTPKTFSAVIQDIDGNSTRDAKGVMHRDRITSKRKLTIGWGPLSNAETAAILQAVSQTFFQVTYPDPQIGAVTTGTFYVGDRTAPSYSWNSNLKKIAWQNISFDLIEQ